MNSNAKLKDQYIYNLKRLEKAEEYFKSLSDEDYMNIEDKKPFRLLQELLKETNDIYYKLKLQGIELPINLRGIKW